MLSRASVRIVLLETPQDRRSNRVKNGKQPFLQRLAAPLRFEGNGEQRRPSISPCPLHDLEQYFTAFDGQLRAFRDTN
jgi:hypothetical protein